MILSDSLPDELLFGRLIRHVTVSGQDPYSFLERVLGSSRVMIHPLLTSGINNFSEYLSEDPMVMLYANTIAPVFFLYLPMHAKKLENYLLKCNGNKALWESQLASFGHGDSTYIKWCPQCAVEDLQIYGVSYWHRCHQVPGVLACYKHSSVLSRIDLKMRQRLVSGLFPRCDIEVIPASNVECRVAGFSADLLKIISSTGITVDWALAYRRRLYELGYITKGGRIRRLSLLSDFYNDVCDYPKKEGGPLPKDQNDFRYLSELLLTNTSHHPFRHILFGCWLYDSAYQLFDKGIENEKHMVTLGDAKCNDVESECLELLRQGKSLAFVYRTTGKSRCYLKRIAMLNDVAIKIKPSKLSQDVFVEVIRLARLAMHRNRIALICNVSVGTVEQVISSQSGLVSWRKMCRFESKRRRYRLQLIRFIMNHTIVTRSDIVKQCNSAFFWLYANDKVWLNLNMPEATKAKGRHSKFNSNL